MKPQYIELLDDDLDAAWLLSQAPTLEFHLPGQHDQKDHGRRGVSEEMLQEFAGLADTRDERSGCRISYVDFDEVNRAEAGFEYADYVSAIADIRAGMQHVGTFELLVNHDRLIIDHLSLAKGDHTSTGYGTRLYRTIEEAYDRAGGESIYLWANLTVGGYSWARLGFDFRNSGERATVRQAAVQEWLKRYPDTDPPLSTTPHSWEIAALTGPDGYAVGKAAMLGSKWYGYKDLRHGSEGRAVGEAYYRAKDSYPGGG